MTWANGRDALCVSGKGNAMRAGLVTYGEGNANCSLSGSATREADVMDIVPTGDPQCTIEVTFSGDQARLGPRKPACGYYCGPTADYAGRRLQRMDKTARVTDFAGDSLC